MTNNNYQRNNSNNLNNIILNTNIKVRIIYRKQDNRKKIGKIIYFINLIYLQHYPVYRIVREEMELIE